MWYNIAYWMWFQVHWWTMIIVPAAIFLSAFTVALVKALARRFM
jgi:hypothetical protein